MESGHLRTNLTETAWSKLEQNLHRASLMGDPSGRPITQTLRGWLEYAAPTFRPGKSAADQHWNLVDRLSAMLNTVSMDEQRLPRQVIHHMWRTAHHRWRLRRRRARSRMEKLPWCSRGLRPAHRKQRSPSDAAGRSSGRASLRWGRTLLRIHFTPAMSRNADRRRPGNARCYA